MGGLPEGRGTGGGWGHNSVVRGAEGDGWLARRARYRGGGWGHNSVARGAEGDGWLARRARYRGGGGGITV